MIERLLDPATFEFVARYLLAGYVVIFVRSAFVLGLRPKPAELLIEAVILSLIVQLFLIFVEGFHGWVVTQDWAALLPTWFAAPSSILKIVVRVLVVPTLFGVVLGLFLQSGWRNNLLRRFSLPVVHPVRRAHDFAFGNDRPPGLVEITYDDGTKVAGWFGKDSLASTDESRSDLYLERTYIIDDNGDWKEPTVVRSILISLRNVRSIEFLLDEETEYNG